MLAFARRQSLAPEPTDLDSLFDRMRPILDRSMGGLIQIGIDVAPDTWPALVDPVQLELAILNLAINARDAMPEGGRLMLRTANVTTLVGSSRPADLKPGDYVMVSVEDTGTGMDAATLARVFDPFFTTKGIGKGSGLGLSMVHGMTAQSGGGVSITSTLSARVRRFRSICRAPCRWPRQCHGPPSRWCAAANKWFCSSMTTISCGSEPKQS